MAVTRGLLEWEQTCTELTMCPIPKPKEVVCMDRIKATIGIGKYMWMKKTSK